MRGGSVSCALRPGQSHHQHHPYTSWRKLIPARVGRTADDCETSPRSEARRERQRLLSRILRANARCARSVLPEEGGPGWRRGRGEGWLTAEYGDASARDVHPSLGARARGSGGDAGDPASGIGRSCAPNGGRLRLGRVHAEGGLRRHPRLIAGGPRTAAITGASVALVDALWMLAKGNSRTSGLRRRVAG